jgi:hypothetical protein
VGTTPSLAAYLKVETHNCQEYEAYHVETVLPDGRYTLLIDSGAVGNLCGDQWAIAIAKRAQARGEHPGYQRRPRPLLVSGVGEGSQACTHDSVLPLSMRALSGQDFRGNFVCATVPNSSLPGLLGLESLRKNRCVIDFVNLKLYMCGPDDVKIAQAMPQGTDVFECLISPSGHLAVPCCEPVRQPNPPADVARHLTVQATPVA